MEIYQLAYLSFTTDLFDQNPDDHINQILDSARKYNEEHKITGILLFKAGVFMQLIEGEKEEIEKLFDVIQKDKRHNKHKIIVGQNAPNRLFENWTMSFKKVDQIDLDLINTILPWKSIIDDTQAGRTIPQDKVMQILKEFRYQL